MYNKNITDEFSAIHTFLRDCMDIIQDEVKLRMCYSNTHSWELEENMISSYAFNIPVIAWGEENEKARECILDEAEAFSKSPSTNPIFIYAHIGQGKTTYLLHFVRIRMKEDPKLSDLRNKVYFIYIPFTDDDDQCSFTKETFINELSKIFINMLKVNGVEEDYNTLSKIFPAQDAEYSRIGGSSDNFSKFIIEKIGWACYLRKWIIWFNEEKKIKVCCILDNIDQHFNLIDDINYFYRLFQTIMSYKIQLIIPLRVSNQGFLNNSFFDAYHPIPVTLSLPNFGELIDKRLQFIERHFEEKLNEPIFKIGNSSMTTTEIFSKFHSLTKIISTNKHVKKSLELLSNYNSRSFLKIIVNSFSSRSLFYHPLSGESINYNEKVTMGKFHSMFLYSLMLRNSEFYYEEGDKTPIINLFSNKSINNWNTFIKFHLLKFIERYNNKEIGFKKFCEDFTKEYNIEIPAIKRAINTFIEKKCVVYRTPDNIEQKNIKKMIDEEEFFLSISPRGLFHLTIVSELEYYEVLAIPDLIGNENKSPTETTKKERADNLLKFLKKLKEEERCVKSILKDETKVDDYLIWTKNILPNLWNDFKKVFSEYSHPINI